MFTSRSYNEPVPVPPEEPARGIKVESPDTESTLHSFPTRSTSLEHSFSTPSHTVRRPVIETSQRPTRTNPYSRDNSRRTNVMATSPDYGSLTSGSSRSGHNRIVHPGGSGDGDPSFYPMGNPYLPMQGYSTERPDSGSPSSTSSLTGAMGSTHLSASPRDNSYFAMDPSLVWSSNQLSPSPSATVAANQGAFPGVAGHGPTRFPSQSVDASIQYAQYSSYRHQSPEVLSPHSFGSPSYDQFGLQPSRSQHSMSRGESPQVSGMPMSVQAMQNEIRQLRKRVHDLECASVRDQERIRTLQCQGPSSGIGTQSMSLPTSAAFQESWRARTNARTRQFCSLNRAGNALCAWHDSRRERRAYPPRMAPAGRLNCGCTYEEALFEESLARHGVGNYHPGESVRMDPALRRPLLELLQRRYGYQDGDFERNPITGDWVEGEGPAVWEQKVQSGSSSSRRVRGDH